MVWKLDRDIKYPSGCDLYLDGHHAQCAIRQDADVGPIVFKYVTVSESSLAPLLFSPLVVTGEKAFPLPA